MTGTFLTVSPPLPLDVHARWPASALPFPFHEGPIGLFARARQGLWECLRRLNLAAGSVALVPAYHHGSEIEVYVRAGVGLRYYEAGTDLAPDPAELDARFDRNVRILHIIHYLGFSQDVERWRAWCDRRGVTLVEDTAQGWLGAVQGRPLGTWGEVSLFSIYKTIGVQDGGAATLQGSLVRPSGRRRLGLRGIAVKHGAWLAGRSALAGALWARLRRIGAYVPEKDFSLGDPARRATTLTSTLLPRLVVGPVAGVRARHYRRLLHDLAPWVPEPFRRDPEELSPFAFPVFVDDKERAAALLLRQGIRAVNAWSVPHPSLPVHAFPGAAHRRSGTLLLPVHQELRAEDLDHIVSAARGALGAPVYAPANRRTSAR
jgi:hypothetical protein